MAWKDDILKAEYTSPNGNKFSFIYGDLEKETDLKTATFTFPAKAGALVQSLGRGGRRFPMECIFSGSDCMSKADAFEAGLEEKGIGELQSPVYGTRKVVPTGTIKRTDAIISNANTVTVFVTFAETITDDTISSAIATKEKCNEQFENVQEALVNDFANAIKIDSASQEIKIKSTLERNVIESSNNMESIAKLDNKVYTDFLSCKNYAFSFIDEITSGVTSVINLGNSIFKLFALPSKICTKASLVLASYKKAYDKLQTVFASDPADDRDVINQAASTTLSLGSSVVSLGNSLVVSAEATSSGTAERNNALNGTGFRNREEAINAIIQLEENFDDFVGYADKYTQKNLGICTSETIYTIKRYITDVQNTVLQSAFNLPGKKVITLGENRGLFELLAELYGSTDKIDEFITDNNLNADEIMIIPMGREVSYYV